MELNSGSCPMVGLHVCAAKPLGSATRVFVFMYVHRYLLC
jgi:hypothetical protein